MDRKELELFLGEDWELTLRLIRNSLKSEIHILDETNVRIMECSGKQLRIMISLMMARACGNGEISDASHRYAAATEILHNATLLHDDVVDCSDERRGSPTVRAILGGTASVLIGDFWLVKAMELVLQGKFRSEEAAQAFSKTMSDLVEGEMLQLEKAADSDTSLEDYFRIIYSKTASLFETACVAAALSVGASDEMKAAAKEYGASLGIAFQIKDDILDYTGEDLGKPTGKDLMEQKITLPLLGALLSADKERDKEVRGMVGDVYDHPEYCDRIKDFVEEMRGVEYAETVLYDYVRKAKKALSVLPDSKAKWYLEQLADFSADRIS